MTNTGLLILGIGSPYGEDTLGWQIIDTLSKSSTIANNPEITLLKADRPGAVLLDLIKDHERVILIDALKSGATPGRVNILTFDDLAKFENAFSSHGFGVSEALALGQAIGHLPEQLIIVGVEVVNELTPQLTDQVDEVIRTMM